ncbi:MAG TPA: multicopper oxidase domain-containing protein [Gemmatimonadales bacterium]|jgi:FtsP/CotA-like multicopper oxidase with cupredoxin domain|nr:multicopper oxidase domain-containing protein [Gemmatimonadales bacterium]
MRLAYLMSLGLIIIARPGARPRSSDPLPIAFNDNLAPAGTLSHGVLTLSLVAHPGEWRPYGSTGGVVQLLAFGEAGRPLQSPGPLIRVPLGTRIRARVENLTGAPLVVHGLATRRVATMDSLLIAPGATGQAEFTTDAPGTFYYWGSTAGEAFNDRVAQDEHLNGALVVDSGGISADRIFVMERWNSDQIHLGWHQVFSINGRPWPYTERLTYDVGDSIRWRVINASNDVHPLHLHGFFYRVDARGDLLRDTLYWPAQRRMGVTERMEPGTTMEMVWHPDRPGNWVFHCHLNYHVTPNAALPPDTEPLGERDRHIHEGYPDQHPVDHAQHAMGGLVLGIYVRPPAGWHLPAGAPRTLRLLVSSDSGGGDRGRGFGYSIQEGSGPATPGVRRAPGPPVVLHRGEPTRIWVVNRSTAMTLVHWHGLEIESYFDGVAGMSGTAGRIEQPIQPGDSMEVLVTPPRAGSFMYHTHINDPWQQSRGLYGPLIVIDSAQAWHPETNLIFMIGDDTNYIPVLNGGGALPPLELDAGTPYRLRLMNITTGGPRVRLLLVHDGAPVQWKPLAKDGYDLPSWQSASRQAVQLVSIGETYDFQFQAPDTGSTTLELRRADGTLLGAQVMRFGTRARSSSRDD